MVRERRVAGCADTGREGYGGMHRHRQTPCVEPRLRSRRHRRSPKGGAAVSDLIQLYATANIRIAELERENAALKAALDAQMKYQKELRTDRDRLDYLERNDNQLRATIDAAMKVKQ